MKIKSEKAIKAVPKSAIVPKEKKEVSALIGISCFMIVKNEEKNIARALASLVHFFEVVVLDTGSTDRTLEIAREFSNVRVFEGGFRGFGMSKNEAAALCTSDIVLNIDADEELSLDLVREIAKMHLGYLEGLAASSLSATADKTTAFHSTTTDKTANLHSTAKTDKTNLDKTTTTPHPFPIYAFYRDNFYRDRLVAGAGWGHDLVRRLYDRRIVSFSDALVHEGLVARMCPSPTPSAPKGKDGKAFSDTSQPLEVITLRGRMHHYSFSSISALYKKLDSYTELFVRAQLLRLEGTSMNRFKAVRKKASSLKAFLNLPFTFIKCYLFQRGFLYGYRGFMISLCNALGSMSKYMKLCEALTPTSPTLIISAYNSALNLACIFEALRFQETSPAYIVVADDGSQDDTEALISLYQRLYFPNLIHTRIEDEGFRLSHSRNAALRAILEMRLDTDYVIFIDADILPHKSFIKDHLAFAQRGVVLQGGRKLLDEKQSEHYRTRAKEIRALLEQLGSDAYSLGGREDRQGCSKEYKEIVARMSAALDRKDALRYLFNFKDVRRCIPLASLIARPLVDASYLDRHRTIKGVRTCNLSCFLDEIVQVNGFNEDITGWGREDSEFVARMLYNGSALRRLKFAATCYHLYHPHVSRESLARNDATYDATRAGQKKLCENGIFTLGDKDPMIAGGGADPVRAKVIKPLYQEMPRQGRDAIGLLCKKEV